MLVIGIDCGTQSLKAIATDEHFAIAGEASRAYPTHRPGADAAEQDPADWEAALAPAIREALERAGARADDVAAIAIAAQLDGCIAVDAAGDPIGRALIWQDKRAGAHARGDGGLSAAQIFAITGQVADPSHLAPKIRALHALFAARELADHASHGATASSVGAIKYAARWHEPTTYLVERLTGVAAIDHALASTTLLYDVAARGWSRELLDAYAIDAASLPAIRDTCDLAGKLSSRGAALTGLPIGTPVAVGTGDDFATPLGAGIVSPGAIVCAIGTAEVVGALSIDAVFDRIVAEPMVETHAYPSGGFFVENPGWLSGGAVRWAIDLLGVPNDAAFDALAATVPDTDGVTFVPALAGAMTPVWRASATATFHGLAARHTRAHLARAVLEGLAFGARDVIDRLRAMGLPANEVIVLGGGARSRVWAQIRADALGLPHRLAPSPNTCAIGAAMIAAVAAGAYPDLAAAAARIAPGEIVITPRSVVGAAYDRYRRLVETLAPLWI